MTLTTEQMDGILAELQYLFGEDENLVAIDVEHDENGENPTILLQHLEPNSFNGPAGFQTTFQLAVSAGGDKIEIPIQVVKSDPITLELAGPDEKSIFDDIAGVQSLIGLAGTKLSRESGSWGTLCLSANDLTIQFDGKTCANEGPAILTNSHVARTIGNKLYSFGVFVGTVSCIFDLNARRACDTGQAPWTNNLATGNLFRLYNPQGASVTIDRLEAATLNASVFKQGARTGLSSGRVTGKTITRVKGYSGLYPSWKGTYKSDSGDSGSPILTKGANGEVIHVGIHFSSGPRFQSWDDVRITVTPE